MIGGGLAALIVAPVLISNDHLEPEPGALLNASAVVWKLGEALVPPAPDAERHAVMVTVPSRSDPEESVYVLVHLDDSGEIEAVARKLAVSLHRQLGRDLQALSREARDAALCTLQVPVETSSAPLSKATLERLDLLWGTALAEVAPFIEPEADFVTIRADGTRFHFANAVRGAAHLEGQTWSPPAGTRMAALVAVGRSLADYVRAPVSERPARERELNEATELAMKRLGARRK